MKYSAEEGNDECEIVKRVSKFSKLEPFTYGHEALASFFTDLAKQI